MQKPGSMTPRQRLFAAQIVKGASAKDAAIAAGYKASTAGRAGEQILARPEVAKAVAEGLQRAENRAGLDKADVLEEARRILLSDVGEIFDMTTGAIKPLSEMSKEVRACISSIEVEELFDGTGDDRRQIGYVKKVKLWDKTKALDLLMRHFDLLAAVKVEHKHDVRVLIAEMTPEQRLERAQTIALKAIELQEDAQNG
jgi:phage terminase small subunit